MNNPIRFIDPSGLKSYILFDPGFCDNNDLRHFASRMEMELMSIYGTPVTTIRTDRWTGESFEAWWNNLSGRIDSIHVMGHGNPDKLVLDWGRYGQMNHLGIFHFITADNVSNLNPINMDMLVLWGCNNGHLDQNNLAMAFTGVVGNGRVIAADGATFFSSSAVNFGFGPIPFFRHNYRLSVINAAGFNGFRHSDSSRGPSGFVSFQQQNGVIEHNVLGGGRQMPVREMIRHLYNASR